MSSHATFDAFLKQVYCGNAGNFLRADGTWFRPEDAATVAAQLAEPEPPPEPLAEDEAPIVVEAHQLDDFLAKRAGYTRGDLVRMRKVEQLRNGLDRGIK